MFEYDNRSVFSSNSVDITPMDPRWVGAWWIPFLISGVVMFLVTLPMLGYPKRLPGKFINF